MLKSCCTGCRFRPSVFLLAILLWLAGVFIAPGPAGAVPFFDTATTPEGTPVAIRVLDNDTPSGIVIAKENGKNSLCGTGAGGACVDVSADVQMTLGVALGDLNHDHFLDAVFVNWHSAARQCLATGQGASPAPTSAPRRGTVKTWRWAT